jgi:hypothetical protein
MRKPARVWLPGEYEAELVAPAVSGDTTRAHLCKPWGQLMNNRGFICGTDGHRLHAIACEDWKRYERTDVRPPPAEQVIPWDASWLGEIMVGGLEDARAFPARWDIGLEVSPPHERKNRLCVAVPVGSGKKAKRLYPFGRDGVAVDYVKLEQLSFSFGISLQYLLDAVDFVGTGTVHAWCTVEKRHQDLSPIAFTPTHDPLRDAKRLAVVMPRRI